MEPSSRAGSAGAAQTPWKVEQGKLKFTDGKGASHLVEVLETAKNQSNAKQLPMDELANKLNSKWAQGQQAGTVEVNFKGQTVKVTIPKTTQTSDNKKTTSVASKVLPSASHSIEKHPAYREFKDKTSMEQSLKNIVNSELKKKNKEALAQINHTLSNTSQKLTDSEKNELQTLKERYENGEPTYAIDSYVVRKSFPEEKSQSGFMFSLYTSASAWQGEAKMLHAELSSDKEGIKLTFNKADIAGLMGLSDKPYELDKFINKLRKGAENEPHFVLIEPPEHYTV